MPPARLVLAGLTPPLLPALRLLLEQEPDLQIVAEVGDVCALLDLAATTHFDLVFTDSKAIGAAGCACVDALCTCVPGVRIVALCARYEDESAARAAGVDVQVRIVDGPDGLLAALRRSLPERPPPQAD